MRTRRSPADVGADGYDGAVALPPSADGATGADVLRWDPRPGEPAFAQDPASRLRRLQALREDELVS